MDRLWSPWRYAYVKAERPAGCVFCDAIGHEDGPGNWVVRREPLAFVILNIYPYNSGHVMVCPTRHATLLSELSAEEGAALFSLAARTDRALRTAMGAEGVNLGANLGRAAGGSIDHVHLHLVPRWTGDTNFMPVVAETKVMVQMLADTWTRLRGADWAPRSDGTDGAVGEGAPV